MAVDALLQRREFEQGIIVKRLRLVHKPVNLHRPGQRMKAAGELRRSFLVG